MTETNPRPANLASPGMEARRIYEAAKSAAWRACCTAESKAAMASAAAMIEARRVYLAAVAAARNTNGDTP